MNKMYRKSLCKFPFNLASISWSSSFTARANLVKQTLAGHQATKIDEEIKYWKKRDFAKCQLFPYSGYSLSPLSSQKLNWYKTAAALQATKIDEEIKYWKKRDFANYPLPPYSGHSLSPLTFHKFNSYGMLYQYLNDDHKEKIWSHELVEKIYGIDALQEAQITSVIGMKTTGQCWTKWKKVSMVSQYYVLSGGEPSNINPPNPEEQNNNDGNADDDTDVDITGVPSGDGEVVSDANNYGKRDRDDADDGDAGVSSKVHKSDVGGGEGTSADYNDGEGATVGYNNDGEGPSGANNNDGEGPGEDNNNDGEETDYSDTDSSDDSSDDDESGGSGDAVTSGLFD